MVIAPVPVALPRLIIAKPFWMKLSSVVLKFKPAAVPSPATTIAADAVLGWIVKVAVPVMFAPNDTASVVNVRLFDPAVIVPAAPVVTDAADNVVAAPKVTALP